MCFRIKHDDICSALSSHAHPGPCPGPRVVPASHHEKDGKTGDEVLNTKQQGRMDSVTIMGHRVTEYTFRMIFRRVSGLGFVISTLNNAGDRPYPENSGGREIDPCGSWYPSRESPGLSQLPKPSWLLTCQTALPALSAHPLRAPACARPYTCAMPKPPRAPPGAPPRPVVRASPPSHRAPVGRPG